MKNEGKSFASEVAIEQVVSEGEVRFRAFADGVAFWEGSLERCGTEDEARKLASVTFGHRTLLSDINDVLVWLSSVHPNYEGDLFVDRYRHQRWTKTVARAVIYHDNAPVRHRLKWDAESAIRALGWVFDDVGNSEHEWFGPKPINDRSAHERLRAIGRVRDALSAFEKA